VESKELQGVLDGNLSTKEPAYNYKKKKITVVMAKKSKTKNSATYSLVFLSKF
jgi:hypothetical protein